MAGCCQTNKFCFCGSLRTGTIIAGIAGILLAIAGIVILLCVEVEFRTIVLDWLPKSVIDIIMVVNFAMTIVISLIMIIGTIKRNMYLMIPWVILGIMLAFGILVSVLWTAISFFLDDDQFNGFIWLIGGVIAFLIYLYMWIIVYSYFCIIKDETMKGRYTRDPFRRKY